MFIASFSAKRHVIRKKNFLESDSPAVTTARNGPRRCAEIRITSSKYALQGALYTLKNTASRLVCAERTAEGCSAF
jgi:hypothetical protein